MDNDDAPPTTTTATTARRPSTTHDRPMRTPFGPRIRTKTKLSDTADTPSSPLSSSALSRPDSPTDPAYSIPIASEPLSARAHVAIQVPSNPSRSANTTFIAPPPLTPPPTVAFESIPIPWKGLPYDAAQWTFSSSELQEIVSKAIRLSARESFVRLLSAQALEVDIAQEADRLDSERATAQAKWRFEVGRRTMLLQALNSSAAYFTQAGNSEPEGENPVLAFIGQLASSIAVSDSLLASILHYSDQQSQITLIQQQHWASALAVALRKLNKAYERQGQELKRAKDRVQTLEDELEEAWREAEKMAIEFDELEDDDAESEEVSDDERPEDDAETADVSIQEIVTGTRSDLLQPTHDIDETGTLGDMTINTDIGVVVGVTATAVASKATLLSSPVKPIDKSDTRSIRSVKSTRSRRSTHLSRVSAARTRSRAASNASLRLPKALRSPSSPVDTPPPMPLPVQSFLDMELAHERMLKDLPPPRTEPSVALPTPPHSAGLSPTRVPSIWLETDGGKSTRLNGLDRTHSLHIFSSLAGRTPRRARRSNLVMSLTGKGSDRSDSGESPVDGERAGSGEFGERDGVETLSGTGTGSPLSSGSPVSLPTAFTFHVREPSVTSSSASVDKAKCKAGRPGSAGARLTTAEDVGTRAPAPRRSLVSRASSVILRRLSQATIGSMRSGTGDKLSLPKSRDALRLSTNGLGVEGWREEGEGEEEGEVMVIGAAHPESSEGP